MTPDQIIYQRRVPCRWSTRRRPATWRRRVARSGSLARRSTSGAPWLSVTGSRRSCPRRAAGAAAAQRDTHLRGARTVRHRGGAAHARVSPATPIGSRIAAMSCRKTTVQKLLVNHDIGRRHQRVARAAALAALVNGLVTEPVVENVFGFCHWASPTRRARRRGQLLHRPPQRRRQGLPAHRHRHRHPVGHHPDRPRPSHHRAHPPVHRPRPAPLAAPRLAGAHRAHRQRSRVHPPGSATTSPLEGSRHQADPAPQPEPQRRVRTLPRHRAAGMLAASVPPPHASAVPPAPSRNRHVAAPLQHPPPQPRRLHARPHTPPVLDEHNTKRAA